MIMAVMSGPALPASDTSNGIKDVTFFVGPQASGGITLPRDPDKDKVKSYFALAGKRYPTYQIGSESEAYFRFLQSIGKNNSDVHTAGRFGNSATTASSSPKTSTSSILERGCRTMGLIRRTGVS